MEPPPGSNERPRKVLGVGLFLLAVVTFPGCSTQARNGRAGTSQSKADLEVMSLTWQKDLLFEQQFFKSFGERNGILTNFVENAQLPLYRKLFQQHSSQPDLVEVDVVWPGMLADDLIDLRPYLKDGDKDFAPELLASYVVGGKLLALPLFVDVGVLYYRVDLLEKYGFHQPPQSWDELEMMAARIQQGERLGGNKDFWGYVWQGAISEGGTCNALEWQSSAGAGNFIEDTGRVHVRSASFAAALQRALRWMGTISPPSEYVYWEDDSMNLWDSRQVAFMRNWTSAYGHILDGTAKDHIRFGVAPLPAGAGGHRGTLGGLGIGISKYAANRELAIKALLELTGRANDMERLKMTNDIPSHISLSQRADVKARTVILAVSAELMKGIVARPSGVLGNHYDEASREYAKSVNEVLRRKKSPENALAELERKLVQITGLPVQRD